MAGLDEAPLAELADAFDEHEFVGPPEEAFKPRPKNVQSKPPCRAPSDLPSISDINNCLQAPSVLYTPSHPANQKSPARRGRPPKSAVNSFVVSGVVPPLPPTIILPRAYNQQRARIPLPRASRQQAPSVRAHQPTGTLPIEQTWTPPQTRFGGLPNFHTSLSNGTRPLVPAPAHTQPPRQLIQPPRQLIQPPQQFIRPPQSQLRPYNRNFRTNSYQLIPQANPVRSAQEDMMRHFSSISPNLNINYLLQKVLSGQSLPGPHEAEDQDAAVREIKRQLVEQSILMSLNPQNSIPPMNNIPVTQAHQQHDLNSLNAQPIQPIPVQKKVPTEDDISKQDDDAEVNQDEEYGEAETYLDYTPSKLTIGRPHPDPVVETSSLAAVVPPDITYTLRLPKTIIDNCLLSALQLESIVYASQQHERFSGDGKTRRGFLIGDGAGVGKGRQIAGIIYENFLAGRRKSVWLSVSSDLKLDAERDLRDIGAEEIRVNLLTKYSYGKKIDVTDGVIFSTYTGLVSRSKKVKGLLGTRLGQLITWLGHDFDGVIVFDECHKAKNISVTKMKQSKTADAVLEFQNKLPGARVVYASATGASETRHLGYMARLGLWGWGTPHDEFSDFCSAIERRGVAAMELVAVDLKMRGSYMARQLSFKTCTFDIRIAELDEKFVRLYNRCVELWSRALQLFKEANEIISTFEPERKVPKIWTCFWAAHQRFFKYLCISAKVPLVVQIAKQALGEGKCVVIGLQATGEARTLEALEDGDISDFISTARATFESLVENFFPAPPRSRPRAQIQFENPPQEQQDTQGSSTDLSSTTLIDETFHNHEVVKFCAENGLATAELEEDKAARELRQSSSRINNLERGEFVRRKNLLEELAKELKASPTKSDRTLRARKRAKARDTRQSRIKKPIDDSETEVSTSTSGSMSDTANPSPGTSETNGTDKTYSESDSTESDSESTLKDSVAEDDLSPPHVKKMRAPSTAKAKIPASDSDSDIEITAVKPRQRPCEFIILTSDDEEEENDTRDPIKVHSDKLLAMQDELYKMIDEIGPDLPHNTLDDLIDQLGGPELVAEMTGRKGRVVKDEDGLISYRQRNETDALDSMNIAEKERFMKGEKLVAIISEAASSGISLQADRRAGNQLRRVHLTVELPWSADRAIQQFGRTHRSNQTSGPEYIFIISELSGEKRFASIVAKRLESLGALTHGDRTSTTKSRDLSQFNISSRFCRHAIENIIKHLEGTENGMHIRPEYNGNFLADAKQAFLDAGLAKKSFGDRICVDAATVRVELFLNRLLGMKVRIQNALFKLFTDYMNKLIARKKAMGLYDPGIIELSLDSNGTTCFVPEDYSLKTRAGVVNCTLRNVQVDRGVSWDDAKRMYDDNNALNYDDRSGFYIYSCPGSSQMIILLLREPDSVDLFRTYKPNMGRSSKPDLFNLLVRGRKYPTNEAEMLWQRIHSFTLEKCIHLCYFGSCKRREARMPCDIGTRYQYYCILSGGILTAWPYLERRCPEATERVRIFRLKLDANNRVIGPNIPHSCVKRVREVLIEGAKTVIF